MGVSLERVQNKFACIIGELCSEPDVLSQFAIWLDLRLAEYKAKGAISLDCSGDQPDPNWLRGHKPPRPKPSQREVIHERPSPRVPPVRSPRSRLQHEPHPASADRLSPDVVVVKEEPSDDVSVFPISLHRHEELGNNRTPTRKRTAAESISSEHNSAQSDSNFFHKQGSSLALSSPKVRRVASSSESGTPPLTLEPVSNQSLMSIISGDLQDANSESLDFSNTEFGEISGNEGQSEDNSMLSSPQGASDLIGQPRLLQSAGETSGSSNTDQFKEEPEGSVPGPCVQLSPKTDDHIKEKPRGSFPGPCAQPSPKTRAFSTGLYPKHYPDRLKSVCIRDRVPNAHAKTHSFVESVVRAVATLERWLWKAHGEERRIEDMPPIDLDLYLAEFFTVLHRPNGSDYEPHSLSNFRSYVERFLKEHQYPCSITNPHVFEQSQLAYTTKRKSLSEIARQKKSDQKSRYMLT